jgi:uncharacterized protein YndB with AHSA1/START domain
MEPRMSEPIVVSQEIAAPIDEVWAAITDRDQMVKWFFETIDAFEPRKGFTTAFNVHAGGKDYPHAWTVTEVIPRKKLVYDWRYPELGGDSSVRWELEQTTSGTKLTLTHVGVETFPQDDPAMRRESCEAGWKHLIQLSLPSYLAH